MWTFGQGSAPASLIFWRPTDGPEDGHVTIGGFAGGDLFDAVGLLLAGGGAAVVVSRWIQSEYHGILGIDGEAFGSAVGLFIMAMFLASAIPAARASRLDPVENLREA